jgi:hypothetical protein
MRKRNYKHPDVEFHYHNETLAVRPSQTGVLKSLTALTTNGFQRNWIFMDLRKLTDHHGNELIDYHRRGVRVGSLDEGRAFIKLCEDHGLVLQHVDFHVPFSNGTQHPINMPGYPIWNPHDRLRARLDIPSFEDIKDIMLQATA